ncbi:UNKNOWN [Stylonychia lemnae]|uniref:Uncharacterized protein n=1 Tax=Stylonychia lemnae TaxID=5949 RepID=A0A078A6Q2_STYLE|nr:UNKNOWN [Stylonychia lemnae]|eukprot:CDW77571.1 UNKNOWN [Stylonychia lemnae]
MWYEFKTGVEKFDNQYQKYQKDVLKISDEQIYKCELLDFINQDSSDIQNILAIIDLAIEEEVPKDYVKIEQAKLLILKDLKEENLIQQEEAFTQVDPQDFKKSRNLKPTQVIIKEEVKNDNQCQLTNQITEDFLDKTYTDNQKDQIIVKIQEKLFGKTDGQYDGHQSVSYNTNFSSEITDEMMEEFQNLLSQEQ